MIEGFAHTIIQWLHVFVFMVLITSREWRWTAILVTVSALSYIYIEANLVDRWISAGLNTKDYAVSAWIDGVGSLALLNLVGGKHADRQGGILAVFSVLHAFMWWSYTEAPNLYNSVYYFYATSCILLNLLQLFLGGKGVLECANFRSNSHSAGSDYRGDKCYSDYLETNTKKEKN